MSDTDLNLTKDTLRLGRQLYNLLTPRKDSAHFTPGREGVVISPPRKKVTPGRNNTVVIAGTSSSQSSSVSTSTKSIEVFLSGLKKVLSVVNGIDDISIDLHILAKLTNRAFGVQVTSEWCQNVLCREDNTTMES